MAEWLALAEVASGDSPADRAVAWRSGDLMGRTRFLADVAAWQAAFSAHAGKRFALYFDDSYAFATALYGAWQAGKEVYLPGDTQQGTVQRLMPQIDGCAGELPGAIRPVYTTTPRPHFDALDLHRTRLTVYTSGSSGEPLAILKSLAQLDAETRTLQLAFGARIDASDAVVYSTVSHQHIYGLLFCVLWPLAAGRPFVTERLAYPEQMAAHLSERACVLVSSPAHLKRLPDAVDWSASRLNLRGIFSSGGPLPPESAEVALRLMGHSPIEVYGSSETGGIAWRQRAAHGDHWTPLPGIAWRIEDELLSVRSPHLPDADWWLTSDRVSALEGGGFVLLGRNDRIVKIEEKRVSLTALETALMACAEIAEAKTLLLTTPGGPRLAAVIVPTADGWAAMQTEGRRAFSESLRNRLLNDVERIALPRRFRYVQSMPVNLQGKSTEQLLLALFKPVLPQLQWRKCEADCALAVLEIAPDLAVFDGHFPEMLVLPGVAQLDWAIEFARSKFALPPRFLQAEALKFQRPVTPPAQLELELRWKPESNQLSFQYRSSAGVHSSGRVVFGD